MSRLALKIVIIISMTVSSWYFLHVMPANNIAADTHLLSTMIDGMVTELSVQQFNSDGKLVNYLQTPIMQHIPNQNTNILQNPHIIVQHDDKAPWEINAKQAISIHGGDQITFSHQVIVHQKELKQSNPMTLLTEEIIYFPQKKLATTTKDVTMKQANNQVQATGMNAYLDENRVQLLSHARGHYAPEHG